MQREMFTGFRRRGGANGEMSAGACVVITSGHRAMDFGERGRVIRPMGSPLDVVKYRRA